MSIELKELLARQFQIESGLRRLASDCLKELFPYRGMGYFIHALRENIDNCDDVIQLETFKQWAKEAKDKIESP